MKIAAILVVATLAAGPALAADVTLRPSGSPAALAKLHKAFVDAAKGGVDYIVVTVDGKVVGQMVLSEMVDPSGVVKAHPTDARKDTKMPHPPGAARANVYEYRLVSKP